MTVRLRPHHLLCMLTHAGEGYSAAFCENFRLILDRIGSGEDILVAEGPPRRAAPPTTTPPHRRAMPI